MSSTTYYELLYIIDPVLKEEEALALPLRTRDIITKFGGSVVSEERIGVRRLSYPIKKFRQGGYFIVNFEADPFSVKDINHEFRLWTGVLRHVITLRAKSFLEKREVPRPQIRDAEEYAVKEAELPRDTETNEDQEDQTFSKEELDKKLEEILNT